MIYKMDKEKKIFELYDKLGYSGDRGKAVEFIANTCDARKTTVKSHWMHLREFPEYVEDNKLDAIIEYLENETKIEA